MADLDKTVKPTEDVARAEDVQILAARALAVLAGHRTPQPPQLKDRIRRLSNAFISTDPKEARRALDRVLGDGVTIDDVIDHVLPAVARLLGERWCADEISFVDVSIGTARCQENVRLLRSRERGLPAATGRDARVLMIIPGSEEHSLGGLVAADQLRRRGIMVDLSIAERRLDLAERLRTSRYRMIGITASGVRTTAAVKELVKLIRKHAPQFTPIALGGPLAEAEDGLKDRLSVDITTTDICAAARRCGLLPTETTIDEELGR